MRIERQPDPTDLPRPRHPWVAFAAWAVALLLLAASAPAQTAADAPIDGGVPASRADQTGPVEREPDSGVAAPRGDPQASPEEVAGATGTDLERQRAELIERIITENDLPALADTGTLNTESFWMPQAASEQAAHTDFLFAFILWVTVIFSVLVIGLMVVFAVVYRHREGVNDEPGVAPTHSTPLEITWTVIPTCIVLVMFTLGFRGFLDQTVAPPAAYEIQVMGRMWNWQFTYPNGAITSDLHVPVDRPVRFVLASEDVIHSLYIPAWRLKRDVVPGRFNQFWATPNRAGVYEVFCAEYCGTLHSRMGAKAFVYPQERFDDMLARISDIYTDFATGEARPPHEVGLAIWQQRGCAGCHSVDGSVLSGPTWKNLWMAERRFTDGTTGVADADYIRESIFYPAAKIVVGYGNAMPSYLGNLTERDVLATIEYIKTLGDDFKIAPDGSVVPAAESTSIGGGENPQR